VELVALGENGIIEGAHNGLNLLIIQPSNPRPLVRLASAWPSMA
jgi:hypothetical protein